MDKINNQDIGSTIRLCYNNNAQLPHCIVCKLISCSEKWIIVEVNGDIRLPIKHTQISNYSILKK